jgi:hypothetical protein
MSDDDQGHSTNEIADCLRKANLSENPADRRVWLFMAKNWLLLSDFRRAAAQASDALQNLEEAS